VGSIPRRFRRSRRLTGKQSRTDSGSLNRSSTGTIVPVDTKGHPVRLALCDSDMRSGLSLDAEGRESEREWLYRRTGCPPVPFVGLGKILWVRTHEPDVYRQTVEWLTPHDYIVHKLSGEYVTSNAVALRVGVLDVEAVAIWQRMSFVTTDLRRTLSLGWS